MATVSPIDAFAAAIQQHEGWGPRSRSFRNNNPGNLRTSPLAHTYDAGGYCVFANFSTGWQALLEELLAKFSGHNEHSVGPQSTIFQLFAVYAPEADHNDVWAYALYVAHWMTLALGRPVTPQTTLASIEGG